MHSSRGMEDQRLTGPNRLPDFSRERLYLASLFSSIATSAIQEPGASIRKD